MNDRQKILNYWASWSIGYALVLMFLIPFAVFLGLSNFQIGIVSAMPYASLVLSQISMMFFSDKVSNRKNFIFYLLLAKRILLIPLLVLPFISDAPIYFIVLVFLMYFFGQLPTPQVTSLLADIVPEKLRGIFFAKKNIYVAIFTTVPYLIAGFFLDIFPKNSPSGFIIIFALGIAIGFYSLSYIARIKDTRYKPEKKKLKNVLEFKGDYGKFTLFTSFFNFAYMIASPFFIVYILKNLGLGYSYFVLATSISTACRIIFSRSIGKISDKYGDKPVAVVSSFGTALVPLAYLLFVRPETVWMIVPAEIISGIAWAGFDISNLNLLLDFTKKEKRNLQVAKFTAVTTIPMIVAPILGGYLSESVIFLFAGIPLVFAVSAVARAFTSALLLRVKEVRAKREYPVRIILKEYFHMPMHALRTAERGIVSYINHKTKNP